VAIDQARLAQQQQSSQARIMQMAQPRGQNAR